MVAVPQNAGAPWLCLRVGEDRASFYKADQLVKLMRENDVQVFIVGIVVQLDKEKRPISPSPREEAERLLNRIAEESGGRVFFPTDVDGLAQAALQTIHDLHFQYLLGFERQSKPGEKGFRKFKVRIAKAPGREELTVITRPGYLVSVSTPGQKPGETKSQ